MKKQTCKMYKILLISILLCLMTINVNSQTVPQAQQLIFSNNFNNLSHNSTSYPIGNMGWKIGSSSISSFRTSAPTQDLSLNANSSASTTSGGIHNYNGKIGFLASTSVDPSIVQSINTLGFSNITVTFDIMTIRNPYDGNTNTRINNVELQYRTDTSVGSFTSVSGSIYRNNTTQQTSSGVTTPQNSKTVTITLPSECNNLSMVQLRWVQRDSIGSGARPSFAIDNLCITGTSTITANGSTTLCSGESVQLTAINGTSWLWSNNDTTQSVTVANSGTYHVSITQSTGCVSTSSIKITVNSFNVNNIVFNESIGIVSQTTSILNHEINNGFDYDYLTMSGTADIRNTTPSYGYASASGEANVFFALTHATNFKISGINTSYYENVNLEFGLFKSRIASDGTEFIVEVSTNDTNYTQVEFDPLPTGTGTAIWHYVRIYDYLPISENLFIRFSSSDTSTYFRLDDINLNGNISNPYIIASGIETYCYRDTITLTASESLEYLWSTSDTVQIINITESGNYYVSVTDNNGCTEVANINISLPDSLAISDTVVNVTCFGQSNGSIDLTITGGTLPYTYLWSNDSTTQDLNNIPVGNYSVTVTDSHGCTAIDSVIVTEPDIPFTKLKDEYCNINNVDVFDTLFADTAFCATQYEFLIKDTSINFSQSIVKDTNYFTLNDMGTIIYDSTTYSVQVRIIIGNFIGEYGITCTITTKPFVQFEEGQIFVKINDSELNDITYDVIGNPNNAKADSLLEFISEYNITKIDKAFKHLNNELLKGIYVVDFDNTDSINELLQSFQALYFTEYAEKVPRFKTGFIPNDTLYNTPQWNLDQINAEQAWDITTGSANVLIAIVDDAISFNHTDLNGNLHINTSEIPGNGIDDDNNGYVDDVNGWDVADNDNNPSEPSLVHGTHVTGIAVAVTNNNVGISSLGFNSQFIPVKCGRAGQSGLTNTFGGIEYAIIAGADVINMSFGNTTFSQTFQTLFNIAHDDGIVLVAAAGNDNHSTLHYPAAYDNVISVGATNQNDEKAWFSNFGNTIDVMAPGDGILSTLPGNNYGDLDGTSMAAPLVSGLCALMLANQPDAAPEQIEHCIESTCDNIDAQNQGSAWEGLIGAGRINASAALQCDDYQPVVEIYSEYTTICENTSVNFIDESDGPTIISWEWSFPGGTPATSTEQNPTIVYQNEGQYDVTLTATNAFGETTVTFTNYITVISTDQCNFICDGGFENIDNRAVLPYSNFRIDNSNSPDLFIFNNVDGLTHQWTLNGTTVCGIGCTPNINNPMPIEGEHYIGLAGYGGNREAVFFRLNNPLEVNNAYRITFFARAKNNNCIPTMSIYGSEQRPCFPMSQITLTGMSDCGEWDFTPLFIGARVINSVNWTEYTINIPSDFLTDTINFILITPNVTSTYVFLDDVQIHQVLVETSDTFVCKGGSAVLEPDYYGNIETYLWEPATYLNNPDIANPTSNPLDTILYHISVESEQGCVWEDSMVVNTLNIFNTSLDINSVTCNGGNNGSIDLSVTGGTLPYTYLWSNTAITQDIFNLSSNDYYVTVTDSLNCIVVDTATVDEPDPIIIDAQNVNVSCYNGNNGSIDLTVTGGTNPYSYLWSVGTYTTQDISGLQAGTYIVTVTDFNNCTSSDTVTITEPTQLTVTITPSFISGTCQSTANAFVNGGTPNYTYLWSNNQTSAMATGLCANTNYSVTVTDANGCKAIDTIFINNNISCSIITTSSTCGDSSGTASAIITGGFFPYSFLWSNNETSQNIDSLSFGTYFLTVIDNINDTAVCSTLVDNESTFTINITTTNQLCSGYNNGSAIASITGGSGIYTYLWSNAQTNDTIAGLAPGQYLVTITDTNGTPETSDDCIGIAQAIIGTSFTASITPQHVICHDDCNGAVNAISPAAFTNVSYHWNTNDSIQSLTGLCPGTYAVTITNEDAINCVATASTTLINPTQLNLELTFKYCFNDETYAVALVTGGVPGTNGYTYNWSNNTHNDTLTLNYLIAEIENYHFEVTVADAWGCAITDSFNLTPAYEGDLISIESIQNFSPAWCGNCNGHAGALVYTVENVNPLNFVWDDTISTGTTTHYDYFCAGQHTLTIYDVNYCYVTQSFFVADSIPSPRNINLSEVNPDYCLNNGIIEIIGYTNMVSPYQYNWSNGGSYSASTELISWLYPGTYTVTVTDNRGCDVIDTAMIEYTDSLETFVTINNNATCYGYCDGNATVNATGVHTPFTYAWDNGETTATADSLCAGAHSVTVTDNNLCSVVEYLNITEPDAITFYITTINPICNYSNGRAEVVNIQGGTGSYSFNWTGSLNTNPITTLAANTYYVTVSDANNCTATGSTTLNCEEFSLNNGIPSSNPKTTTSCVDTLFSDDIFDNIVDYSFSPSCQRINSSFITNFIKLSKSCNVIFPHCWETQSEITIAIDYHYNYFHFIWNFDADGSDYYYYGMCAPQDVFYPTNTVTDLTCRNDVYIMYFTNAETGELMEINENTEFNNPRVVSCGPGYDPATFGNEVNSGSMLVDIRYNGGSWIPAKIHNNYNTGYIRWKQPANCFDCVTLNYTGNYPFASYHWYRNDTLVNGETNSYISAGLSGSYYLVATDLFSNQIYSDTVDIELCPQSGAKNMAMTEEQILKMTQPFEIAIFPNPNTGQFRLIATGGEFGTGYNFNIQVFDIVGNLIFTNDYYSSIVDIDLHEIPTGVYIVKIIKGKETAYKKVIINNY